MFYKIYNILKQIIFKILFVSFGIVLIGVLIVTYFELTETKSSYYKNRASLDSSNDLGAKSWLERVYITEFATNIEEIHNIDSNLMCLRFNVEKNEIVQLRDKLINNEFKMSKNINAKFPKFYPEDCPFSHKDLVDVQYIYIRKIAGYYEGFPSNEHYAISARNNLVMYWNSY